jgi:hypothetical protein
MTDDQLTRLGVAVRRIITDNTQAGYKPRRFLSATEGGYAENLEVVCASFVMNPRAVEQIEDALREHPEMHATLEWEIMAAPDGLGFEEPIIIQAGANAERFNTIRRGEG